MIQFRRKEPFSLTKWPRFYLKAYETEDWCDFMEFSEYYSVS